MGVGGHLVARLSLVFHPSLDMNYDAIFKL